LRAAFSALLFTAHSPRRMNVFTRNLIQSWAQLGPRFLPFADVASADLPLSRLLRLSLFQVSVGMALVLLVGTLNRIMIVELGVGASLVALMVSLPVLYAPMRALIGFRSDTHRSALGWRRVPFIWMGTLIQFGGLAVMPFALLVLAGRGDAASWPAWVGQAGVALTFLTVGAGLHTVQTAGLALATDLAPPEARPRVVGLMYVMLLLGTIASAFAFGWALEDFTPGRLVQVIQAAALATLVLNAISLWKQETRRPYRSAPSPASTSSVGSLSFSEAWGQYIESGGTWLRLAAIAVGTAAFAMQDVLLEPYGGQVLGMTVAETTRLTAVLALGGLMGFGLASAVLGRTHANSGPENPANLAARLAAGGAGLGSLAFGAVIAAALIASMPLFAAGVFFIGCGGGLFGHGTLTMTMNRAPKDQVGLALGAWGAVQATAAGVAVAAGGILRDLFVALASIGQLHRCLRPRSPAVDSHRGLDGQVVDGIIGEIKPYGPAIGWGPCLVTDPQPHQRPTEPFVKVHHILFIVWGIVFAFWLARQFQEYNRRKDES
jgi:MFS transporter, BCD family, chlorophyll transporter